MSGGEGDFGKSRSAAGRDVNIGQVIGSGVIHGNVNIVGSGSLNIARPSVKGGNTLPRDPEKFVGRQAESAHLDSILRNGHPNVVVISGMGGIGKTALSLHAAHKVADFYPDGLIWASLTQHRGEVRAPEDILELLLRHLGIEPNVIPANLESRVALYRSLLHHRRVLIVLDDAASGQQVQWLLPPASSSAVIITSRRRLVSLYDAAHIELYGFTPLESVEFLEGIIGPQAALERQALLEIAELCENLPLAIAIVGARLRARPDVSAGELATELAERSRHLDRLGIGETNVRAVFDLSYRQLSKDHAKAFRLLSWFPGPRLDVRAAAALLDTSNQIAQRWLDELADVNLIATDARWYRYHDLLREYAREASGADPLDDRTAALARLRDWYLKRIRRAISVLTFATTDGVGAAAATRNEELAWLEDERVNILNLAAETITGDQANYVWELADALYYFYELRSHWADCQTMHELALQVARSAQNQIAAQRILNNLGVAYREQHQYAAGISCLEESIALARSTGSKETSALALMNLGVALHEIGQLLPAISCLESALSLSHELSLSTATRQILANLGNAYRDMSHPNEAFDAYHEALKLCRSASDLRGEGIILVNLGTLYQEEGLLDESVTCLRQSLEIARNVFDRVSEGRALQNLGSISAARGARDEAIRELEASAEIAEQARDVETLFLACLGLGDIYISRRDTSEARNWYGASHRAAQEIGDAQKEAKVIMSLASVVAQDNEHELSLTYCRRAVALLRDSADPRNLASALSVTGSVLTNLRRAPEALVCLEEAAAISRDLGDSSLELDALTLLTGVLQNLEYDSDVLAVRHRMIEINNHRPSKIGNDEKPNE